MQMSQELKTALERKGWNPSKVTWGERIQGDLHGLTLRLPSGVVRHYSGPLVSLRAGNQAAIVREG